LCRGDIGFKGGGKGGLDRGDLVNLGENGQAREKRVDIKDYASIRLEIERSNVLAALDKVCKDI
jgi:hypothetical protein